MITLLTHIAAAHSPMQTPRTRVGKISEQRMLGIGPNPATNEHVKIVTHVKETAAGIKPVVRNMLTSTSATNEIARIGMVARSNCLQPEYTT